VAVEQSRARTQEPGRAQAPQRPAQARPASLLQQLQRVHGNAALARALGGGRRPGRAMLQRYTYTLARGGNLGNEGQRQAAIDLQNHLLKRVSTVYVEPDLSGMGPYDAWGMALMDHSAEATLGSKAQYPRDKNFAESCPVRFQSEYFSFDVELISAPNLVPPFGGPDAPMEQAVRQRVEAPWQIGHIAARGGGGAIGRTFGGTQFWDVNPGFSGIVTPVGTQGAYEVPQSQWLQLLTDVWKMPPEQHVDKAPNKASLTALPAPREQPFLVYVDPKSDPHAKDVPLERKQIDVDMFEREFDRGYEMEESPVLYQEQSSSAPLKNRKDAKRDPNTAMGISAWQPIGGKPPPMKGKLATHEWCHLVGDADSGKCAPENLYIGTNNVNTEQLAMENALRDFRLYYEKLGWSIEIRARATVEELDFEGAPYFSALKVLYEITLTKPNRPRFLIHEQPMDPQRGLLPDLEYKGLLAFVAERLEQAKATVTELDAGAK
jgi:hypothetical protein